MLIGFIDIISVPLKWDDKSVKIGQNLICHFVTELNLTNCVWH